MKLVTKQCVHCGTFQHPGTSPLTFYSATTFNLSKCKTCSHTLDPFVEFQFSLIALELMLHRVPAFRHLISNKTVSFDQWMRFTLVCTNIETLSQIWRNQRELTSSEFIFTFSQTSFINALCFLSFSTCASVLLPKPIDQGMIFRSWTVGRFPVLILVIALAWGYNPEEFFWGISVYCFSITLSCAKSMLSEINERNTWVKAGCIAFLGVWPRICFEGFNFLHRGLSN
jgi:hypothetical protein